MDQIKYECRHCGKATNQLERIVTNNLPSNVKVLQCVVCSYMSVCLMALAEVDCD